MTKKVQTALAEQLETLEQEQQDWEEALSYCEEVRGAWDALVESCYLASPKVQALAPAVARALVALEKAVEVECQRVDRQVDVLANKVGKEEKRNNPGLKKLRRAHPRIAALSRKERRELVRLIDESY